MTEMNPPHPKNAPGPFYVVYGCCTACDVPMHEAPGMFAYDENNHCFVTRQPQSSDEINGSIRAAWAAELGCIRYRGDDPNLLRRLAELGEAGICDSLPPANLHPIVRNRVTFDAASKNALHLSAIDIAEQFAAELKRKESLRQKRGHDFRYEFTAISGRPMGASFAYSWFERNFHNVDVTIVDEPKYRWLMRVIPCNLAGSRAVCCDIDDWLKSDKRFCSIRWFTDEQWGGSREWQDTPY